MATELENALTAGARTLAETAQTLRQYIDQLRNQASPAEVAEFTKKVKQYSDELHKAGVTPKHLASYAANLVGSDVGGSADQDNMPGYQYLQRVAGAGYRALMAHGEATNKAWAEIRRGRYGIGSAMKTYASLAENYYGVLCEATRGPESQPRPSWLVIDYSLDDPPAPDLSVRIDAMAAEGVLESTKFEGFGTIAEPVDLYRDPPECSGSRISIFLDADGIARLQEQVKQDAANEAERKVLAEGGSKAAAEAAAGKAYAEASLAGNDYVSFIFPKGAGAAPPLAIVVVRFKTSGKDNEGGAGPAKSGSKRPSAAPASKKSKPPESI